jgi:hypothetical protein
MANSLQIANIRIDAGTQMRAKIDQSTVDDYAEKMAAGDKFPAVVVFIGPDGNILADGFHRLMAARKAGQDSIDIDAHMGSLRDAILHAVKANALHGLRRTNEDKRRAVNTLLDDAEWSKWSDREIAKRCGVSHNFVSDFRKAILSSDDSMKSDDRVFTHHKTGKPATMNVAKIGQDDELPFKPDEPEPFHTEAPVRQSPVDEFNAGMRAVIGHLNMAREQICTTFDYRDDQFKSPFAANASKMAVFVPLKELTRWFRDNMIASVNERKFVTVQQQRAADAIRKG